MKITKSVKSDININVGSDNAKTGTPIQRQLDKEGHEGLEFGDRKIACDLIQKAIDELSKIADSDEVARDSIANLGVVLLDLRS